MTNAPETIWASKSTNGNCIVSFASPSDEYCIAYIRADIAAARLTELEGFIRDFAACKFDALPHPFTADPQDRPDDVTDHAAVLNWQDDARGIC